ncbi:MAG: molybdopterin-dependent oxidoreductase [Gammaproteobacteria bacterium]|nr:molybdopterin-dependent oxidoreductase [Gammaproteobacteria bacterium]
MFKLTRRRLLAGTAAVAGGGLVLALLDEDAAESRLVNTPGILEPNAYLQITPAGEIILQIDKAEMGQGVITGFVTLVAEELGVRPAQIDWRAAPIHPLFQTPSQITSESRSMRSRWDILRLTGARAREMLRAAAAERWAVAADDITVLGNGSLRDETSGDIVGYGALAEAAARQAVPREPPLTAAADYKYIGTDVQRPDAAAKVYGTAVFGTDVRVAGMKMAVILRPPRFGDELLEFDGSAAAAQAGVTAVLEVPAGVAVVADTWWAAHQARQLIKAQWSDGPLAGFGPEELRRAHVDRMAAEESVEARDDGDIDAGFAAATKVVAADYSAPFLAHVTMEPMNATVRVTAESCEIWAPSQGPDLCQQVARKLTGLSREQIVVHTPLLGGGFGRRATVDYVAEAITIAQQLSGVPIQLLWSREDDLRGDYFRGATSHRLRVALDDENRPIAWHHSLAAPVVSQNFMEPWLGSILPEWFSQGSVESVTRLALGVQRRFFGPFQAWDGAVTVPYAIPNLRVDVREVENGLRVGIWRSVGNSYNAFVVESFIDELAHELDADPVDLRRSLLTEHPRHLAVLDRLIKEAEQVSLPAGRTRGLALHASFDSVIGQVAEVSVSPAGVIRVHRVICVVDCGLAINPDIVKAQMESGIVCGLTAALYSDVKFADGKVLDSNFHDHPVLRLREMPAIDTHIIESGPAPAGIGEAGTPAIAPAIANAVFAATGTRLRDLPLRLS